MGDNEVIVAKAIITISINPEHVISAASEVSVPTGDDGELEQIGEALADYCRGLNDAWIRAFVALLGDPEMEETDSFQVILPGRVEDGDTPEA